MVVAQLTCPVSVEKADCKRACKIHEIINNLTIQSIFFNLPIVIAMPNGNKSPRILWRAIRTLNTVSGV